MPNPNTISQPVLADSPLARPPAQARSLGWVLRRAGLGLVLLLGFTLASAWLLDASIDASADAAVMTTPSE